MKIKNSKKGFIVQGIIAVVALVLIAIGVYYIGIKKIETPQDNPMAINENSETIGDFKGYYTTYKKESEGVDGSMELVMCQAFTIVSGDEGLIKYFSNFIDEGNTVNHKDKNGNLVININTQELNQKDLSVLQNSTKNNPITLTLQKKIQARKGAPLCYSTFKVLKVENNSKVSSTSDWKTYTDTKLDISFIYPSDWKVVSGDNIKIIPAESSDYNTIYITKSSCEGWYKSHPGKISTCKENGGYIVYDNMSTDKNNIKTVDIIGSINSTFKFTTPAPTVSTSDWKTYTSPYLGFEVKYPTRITSSVGYINNEEWFYVEGGDQGVSFGTPSSKSGGLIWGISVQPKSGFDREKYIKAIGEQFGDRKESRQNFSINGIPALLVKVTTDMRKDWISKIIYLEKDNVIYMIGNGAIDSPEFIRFYNSFKFTN